MFVPIRLSHSPLQFLLTEFWYDLYPLRYESGCWISVAPKPMHNLSIGINSFYKIIRSPKPFGHTISPRWDNLTRSEQIPAIPAILTFFVFSITIDYLILILCSIRCLLHLKQFLLTVSVFHSRDVMSTLTSYASNSYTNRLYVSFIQYHSEYHIHSYHFSPMIIIFHFKCQNTLFIILTVVSTHICH